MRNVAILLVLMAFATGVSAQDARQTMTVGTAAAARGQVAYGELKVPPKGDDGTNVPVAVIHGANPGKVVAFIAGSHGTEYASTVALTRLIARIDPKVLSGTVIVAPLLNVASFEQMIVHLNPVDKKGMNGGYPGNANGTQTERVVERVATEIVAPADVIVDLHGGDIDEDLRPYSYLTRTGNAAQDDAARALVMAFGLNTIILRDVDASNPAGSRSLGGYALSKGKISIVAEAGRAGTVEQADVDALIDGCLNVLGSLKMIPRQVKPLTQARYITNGSRVAADKPGMFFPTVKRDTIVAEGAIVGYTTDYLGRKTADIKAPVAGLVTFIRPVPSMWATATLVNVSPVLPSLPPYKKPTS